MSCWDTDFFVTPTGKNVFFWTLCPWIALHSLVAHYQENTWSLYIRCSPENCWQNARTHVGCSHQYTTLHLIFKLIFVRQVTGAYFLEHNFYIIFTSSPLTLGLQYSVITDCRILDTETFQNFPETFQQGISILVWKTILKIRKN